MLGHGLKPEMFETIRSHQKGLALNGKKILEYTYIKNRWQYEELGLIQNSNGIIGESFRVP